MPYPCLFNCIDWPTVISIAAALALTALMFAFIWVACDGDDYSEDRRNEDD